MTGDGADIRHINVNGQMVAAELVGYQPPLEAWSEIMLNDGTLIRTRQVVVRVVKLLEQFDQFGEPQYLVFTQPVTVVSAPASLRKAE